MRYSILFVVVLILLSGFIAYFGDLLGRRMGKRRLTLLRMRPRYTAILFTVLTGMVIAAVALSALVTANSQFRRVLTEGEAILSQNDSLRQSNIDLSTKNIQLSSESKSLAIEVEQRAKDAETAREESAKLLKARNEAQDTVRKLEQEITHRKLELERLKSDSKVTKAKLQQSTLELDKVKIALDEAKEKLQKAEEQYISASMDLRSGILIAKQGDEIIRGTIKTGQSRVAIREDILKLLSSAGERVQQIGAALGDNRRAVSVIFRQKISENLDYLMREENVFINKASETISASTSHDQILVQVVCARNTLRGEQVPVELKLYPNVVVYKEGAKITATQIDGSQSEGRILMNLTAFLQAAVGWNALHAGVIPVSGNVPKIDGDANSLGQVEALMSTVDKIKRTGKQTQVTVFAGKDIRAEGPMNMSNMHVEVEEIQ